VIESLNNVAFSLPGYRSFPDLGESPLKRKIQAISFWVRTKSEIERCTFPMDKIASFPNLSELHFLMEHSLRVDVICAGLDAFLTFFRLVPSVSKICVRIAIHGFVNSLQSVLSQIKRTVIDGGCFADGCYFKFNLTFLADDCDTSFDAQKLIIVGVNRFQKSKVIGLICHRGKMLQMFTRF